MAIPLPARRTPACSDGDHAPGVGRASVRARSWSCRSTQDPHPVSARMSGWRRTTSNLGEVLEKIERLRADHPDSPGTNLYGRSRFVDWSQFRPRGHYVRNAALEAYFRAMMWMGRVDLAWHLDVDRELRDAALLVWLVKKSGQSNRLAAMSRVLDFMVG